MLYAVYSMALVVASIAAAGATEEQTGRALVDFDNGDPGAVYAKTLELASNGGLKEMNQIGEMYQYGIGVATDPASAVYWYRKAAQRGFPDAQYNLANMYKVGIGVEADFHTARYWYLRAAVQEHAFAIVELAKNLFRNSRNLGELCESYYWFKVSRSHNVEYMLPNIDKMSVVFESKCR